MVDLESEKMSLLEAKQLLEQEQLEKYDLQRKLLDLEKESFEFQSVSEQQKERYQREIEQ
jgi:hypothetical protein